MKPDRRDKYGMKTLRQNEVIKIPMTDIETDITNIQKLALYHGKRLGMRISATQQGDYLIIKHNGERL